MRVPKRHTNPRTGETYWRVRYRRAGSERALSFYGPDAERKAAEFARIAEELANATCDGAGEYSGCAAFVDLFDAHAAARLRIVERLGGCGEEHRSFLCDDCTTLAILALPYADHSEFREEWRP